MAPARSIHEAAHGGLLDPRFSPWSQPADAEKLYVDRPSDWSSHPKGRARTLSERLQTRLLSAQGHLKIFFTGQVGSGKSSELERLWQDQDIANHFERLRFVATEEPLDLQAADMRQLLIALAASLARHIERADYHKRGVWSPSERVDKSLRKWIELLAKSYEVEPPNPGDDPTVQFGAAFMKFSATLRSEASVRRRVREDAAFGVVELRELTADLMSLIHKAAGRPLLVVFDDLDKLSHEAADDVFIAHAEVMQRLQCSAVITYPYVLHHRGLSNAIMATEPAVLENVKTVTRDAPDVALDSAIEFFTALLASRVELGLISSEAIAAAVVRCAGIPREFLRVVQRAFLLADEYEQEQVGLEDVESACRFLLRHLIRATQSDETRAGLTKIRRTHRLAGPKDWELVQALLAVEYTNDEPWYDVHPILAGYVDRLIAEEDA